MAYKKQLLLVLFISAAILVNIQGAGLAQPGDNTEIKKQDTSAKELTVDQQVEIKQDRKIRPVQGLRILELSENPARTAIKATDLTGKKPAPTVATDK
jgi:hypothetical protein